MAGKAYALGSGELCGELGLGDRIQADDPTLIEALKDEYIIDIQSSSMHTLALSEEGKIWSWGGNEFGALGREGIENEPRLIEHVSIKYIKFIKVACGYSYSMAISSKGQLYTWGTFKTSQGNFEYISGTQIQKYPRIMNMLADQNCVDIAVGRHHALCLTADGSVYSWGDGDYWQLGHRANPESCRLNLPECKAIACGAFHSLAIDKEDQLYSWGQNTYGQCGLEPYLVIEPSWVGLSCVSVAAGDYHTIVLDENQSVYSFGRCSEGQLGIPLYPGFFYPGSRCHQQRTYAIYRPLKNPWHPSEQILRLVSASNSNLAITESGNTFFWGVSFTRKDERRVPVLADFDTVIHASIGDNFCILIIKE